LPERHRCVVPAEASHTATTYVVVPIDPCPAGIASGSAFGVVEQFRARLMLACITTKRSTTSSVSCQPAARVPTALERMISDPASPSPSTPPNPPHPPRATVPDHRLASALFEAGAATPRARRPRPADCSCPNSTVGSTGPFTHRRVGHLVGNVFPGVEVPLRLPPERRLPATLARKMSPVEMVGIPSRSARTLACVPQPAPGGPMRMRIVSGSSGGSREVFPAPSNPPG
jgi:hypothetical protein